MADATVTIDMDQVCAECGEKGRAANGLCLACTGQAIRGVRMRSAEGKLVWARARAKAPSEGSAADDGEGTGEELSAVVDRELLAEAVKLALAVTPRRPTIPVLGMVRLTVAVDLQHVVLQATDLEQMLTLSLPAEVEGAGGEVVVSPRTLAAVLGGCRGERVSLRVGPAFGGGAELHVESLAVEGGKGWVAIGHAEDFPSEAEPGEGAAYAHVAAKALVRALGMVAPARADGAKEGRLMLSGTYLEIRAGEVIAMASDGRRAACATVQSESSRSAAAGVVFPPRTGDLLLRLATEEELVLTVWEEGIRVETTGASERVSRRLTAKTFAGLFPNVGKVLPGDEECVRARRVGVAALREAVATVADLGKATGEGLHADLVIQRVSPEMMVVEAAGGTQAECFRWIEAKAVPPGGSRVELAIGIEARCVLNPQYVLDALAPLSGDCELRFHGDGQPVVVRASGYWHALMPMRLDCATGGDGTATPAAEGKGEEA